DFIFLLKKAVLCRQIGATLSFDRVWRLPGADFLGVRTPGASRSALHAWGYYLDRFHVFPFSVSTASKTCPGSCPGVDDKFSLI
ncbi:MAG: hypothetical protein PHG44_10130, partial [Lentisphaeria bacterium]|nr:hypothetical protein [Lentisphaeria bacterium]